MNAAARRRLDAALEAIDPERIASLLLEMVAVPSPTGAERPLAEMLARRLRQAGVETTLQVLSPKRANLSGRLNGSSKASSPSVLLYSPIDTHLDAEAENAGRVAQDLPTDLAHVARPGDGRWIVGLGAENPKGFAACVISAFEAITTLGSQLPGDVIIGLGAGGMPVAPPDAGLDKMGCGLGAEALLRSGVVADYAIIAKGSWVVQWDEPGLCWFEVSVLGGPGNAEVRHQIAYRNAVLDCAVVIGELEEWFATYSSVNETASITPQGQIGAVAGGGLTSPAFTPEACLLQVDLRTAAERRLTDVARQFGAAVDAIRRRHPEFRLTWRTRLAIPGAVTDPDNVIIKSTVAAWEDVENQPHVPRSGASGVTDASVLRRWGIPTAKIGMPRLAMPPAEIRPSFAMSIADLAALRKLTEVIVRALFHAWAAGTPPSCGLAS